MRVVVTGATGFIGRHVVPALLDRGYEVHVVTSGRGGQDTSRLIWHRLNILDPGGSRTLFEQVRATHLVHLAWVVDPGAFWTSRENLRWVGASLDLVRTFVESGGKRIVIAGTCAEYRWGVQDLSEETTPLEPRSLYGASKDALRRILATLAVQERVELAWGRLFFLYGPHEPPVRLVPSVTTALLRGEVAHCASGRAERDYLYVADAGEAMAAILDSAILGPVNIASGTAVQTREIITQVGEECGRPDLISLGALPDRPDDPDRICADVRRLRGDVGWTPRVPLDEGIHLTVRWWRDRLRAA
ncbi:MAG: NAD(P)-dependent oxidoreductase [Acidobacteriota bacterium]